MSEFWYTTTTMKEIMGSDYIAFTLLGPVHLFWLALCALLTFLIFRYYPKMSEKEKRSLLILVTVLLIIDELVKDGSTLSTGQFEWEHLPFHLCSINIFICLWNTLHPNDTAKGILYCNCIPGALVALLVPNWQCLPLWNVMHLHSETVHILLFIYPMMILADGFKPELRIWPKVVTFTFFLAVFDSYVDHILGTNFMFLVQNENNPALVLLMNLTGGYYPYSIVLLLFTASFLLLLPWELRKKKAS